MKRVTVTGYKPAELNIFSENNDKVEIIKYAIRKRLTAFIENGLEWVLVSGQRGVELWTAEVVMDLKDIYDINIAIFPPFEGHNSRWPEQAKNDYQALIRAADFYKPLYTGDYKGPFQFRAKNKWLIEKSDGCLMLYDTDYPGSGRFFYNEAKQMENYPVHFITPQDLDDIAEEIRMNDSNYWL